MSASHRRGAATASVVALVVAAVFVASWSGDAGVEVTTDVDEQPAPGDPARPASLAGPTDGVASRLLPVLVEPSTHLSDGQVVAISGSGFTPGATLGAVLCSAGAAGGGGVAFCELAHFDNFAATSEGTFSDDYVLRRFIETPAEGRVDCGGSTDGCLLAVGNINDYDESGGSFITFEGALDPPPPQLTVSPPDGLVDGQVVSVKGTGLRAAPDAWLRQCPTGRVTEATCAGLVTQADGPAVGGQLSVTVRVGRFLGSSEGPIDCAAPPGCVLVTTEYAGRLAVVPLGFAATEPIAGASPPTTAQAEVTTTLPPPAPTTLLPPEPTPGTTGALSDLDLRLELDQTTLAPGESTQGYLTIENNTERIIIDPACALSDIEFGLVPEALPDAPVSGAVETECEPGGFPMPPGFAARWDIPASFSASEGGVPLAPGAYLAVVRPGGGIEPLAVSVTITEP